MGNTATPHWDVIVKDDDWLRSLPKVQLQQESVNTIVESSLSKEELACESRGGFSQDDTRMSPTRVAKKSMDQFVRRCKQTHQSHRIYPGPVTGKTIKCPKKDHEVT